MDKKLIKDLARMVVASAFVSIVTGIAEAMAGVWLEGGLDPKRPKRHKRKKAKKDSRGVRPRGRKS